MKRVSKLFGALILCSAAVVSVAAVDLGLRTWALVDLRRRPAEDVKGPKAAWAAGLSVVSSAGLLPLTYLVFGRRRV